MNTTTANGAGVGTFNVGDIGPGQRFIAFNEVDSSTCTLASTAATLRRTIVCSTLILGNDARSAAPGSTLSIRDDTTLRAGAVGLNVGNAIEQHGRTIR